MNSFTILIMLAILSGVVALSISGFTVINTVVAQMADNPTMSGNMMGGNATGSNITGATFLFIQGAQSGSVSEVNATTSTLELSDVSDKTIMFTDRPDRIVASIDTADFIGNWSTGPDSFAIDPPNAVLILDDVEQRQEVAVIELFNPEYDPEADTLSYDITAENATSIGLPSEFEQSTLVIDDSPDNGLIDRPG
jgi:hypothetical protein